MRRYEATVLQVLCLNGLADISEPTWAAIHCAQECDRLEHQQVELAKDLAARFSLYAKRMDQGVVGEDPTRYSSLRDFQDGDTQYKAKVAELVATIRILKGKGAVEQLRTILAQRAEQALRDSL
jgi:hypothetical protein